MNPCETQTGNWCDLSTNNFVLTSRYVLNLNGETLTEFSSNGSSHSDIPLADGVGATLTADANTQTVTHFQFTDWLGTRRVQTDALGSPEEICTGGAFGDAVNCLGEAATDRHFTGKERDQETASVPGRNDGLDYFGARYYSSNLGRWMTPDWDEKPEAVPYSDLNSPQSLNLYGYVRNNPLVRKDADGHDECCDAAWFATLVGGVETTGQVLISTTFSAAIATGAVLTQVFSPTALDDPTEDRYVANLRRTAAAGSRPGKDFTKAGKRIIDQANASNNGGDNKCVGCDKKVRKVKNEKGKPTPDDQLQRHHIDRKSEGGSGTPENGEVRCPSCHNDVHNPKPSPPQPQPEPQPQPQPDPTPQVGFNSSRD